MRKHWKLKGVIQGLLSRLPYGVALNSALQKSSGDLSDFEDHLRRKVLDFRFYSEQCRDTFERLDGLELVEIGTGWFPMLPVMFSLCGVKRIWTFDKTRHLNAELTFRGLKSIGQHLPSISEMSGQPVKELERRLEELLKTAPHLHALLAKARIFYQAPGDAADTRLPSSSVDAVFSNSVLEHVPKTVMKLLFAESARILRPHGVSIHGVNCGDHYAYFDRQITQINFLQFSERQWALWNNDLLYQNRMRPPDFKALLAEAGLEMIFERRHARPGCAEAFEKMELAPQFRRYDRNDLVCTSFDFVGRPKPAAKPQLLHTKASARS